MNLNNVSLILRNTISLKGKKKKKEEIKESNNSLKTKKIELK